MPSPAPESSSSPPPPAAVNASTAVPPSQVTTTSPPSPPTFVGSPPPPGSSSNNTTLIALGVGIGIGGTIVLLFVGIFVFWYRRRKRRLAFSQGPKDIGGLPQYWQQGAPPPTENMVGMVPKPSPPPPGIALNSHLSQMGNSTPQFSMGSTLGSEKLLPQSSTDIGLGSKTTFTYEELGLATGGFSETNLLGQGGFGYVHKGVLPDGQEVAIKKLKVGSGQGEREFQAEVETINRVHHKHLVSLVGYCTSGTQRLLVYEFVPNNTLEFHLHEKGHIPINWETRMKVALGSAKGLAYLHEDCQPKIVHRDVKASNILLDSNFEPKVADFGLARFYSDTDTHVSTRVMGTFGYLAPEYALTGKLTEKSDVFSFGVMLLELITGRRPIDKGQFLDDNIVDWFRLRGASFAATKVMDPECRKIVAILAKPRIRRSRDARVILTVGDRLRPQNLILIVRFELFSISQNFGEHARPLLTEALEDDNFETLADPRLQKDYDTTEMRRMVACAAVCVRHLARRRPRMSQIVLALEGNLPLEDLNEGIRPGHSTIYGSHDSSDYDKLQYKEDLLKFRKIALEGQENNSSGCSGPTSDFGHHPSASSSEGLRTTTRDIGWSSERQKRQSIQKDEG